MIKIVITSGSRGGGRTRRAPPLTAADLWFLYAQNASFLKIFFPKVKFWIRHWLWTVMNIVMGQSPGIAPPGI